MGFSGEPYPKSFTEHRPLAAVDSASKPAKERLQLCYYWPVFMYPCSGATQDMRAMLV